MTDADRITGLLEANTELVEARRALATKVAARDAIIDELGRALVEAKERRAAAESRAEEAASQAARMLPARLDAERRRDAAEAALRTLQAGLAAALATGIDTFRLGDATVQVTSQGERRFAAEADLNALLDRLHALLPPAPAPAAPVTTNG